MSKAATKSAHWMPKTGSYTIRLNRRGDIGSTLPKKAQEHLLDDIIGRQNRSVKELEELERKLALTRGDDNRAILIKRKFQLQAELKNLRFERHIAYLPLYSEAFLAAARMLLDEATLKRIDAEVVSRIGVLPARHWQRFLGENGFGRVDTSTYKDK